MTGKIEGNIDIRIFEESVFNTLIARCEGAHHHKDAAPGGASSSPADATAG
jgi:hypothetical protein